MEIQKTLITIICLLFFSTSFGQISALRDIDNRLSISFKKMIDANDDMRYDSLAPDFKRQLEKQLQNPVTFYNTLDSLSKHLQIITSADKRIKFYSWDNHTGGTWHYISCLAQFVSDDGKIVVQQLHSESSDTVDYTDSGIYSVYDLSINGKTYYLTFAYGTHGQGYHHEIAQIFSIASNRLVKCRSCFLDNEDLIIEYPRVSRADLYYNAELKQITYNEFKYNNDEVWYSEPTGRIITLKLIDGIFK